MGTEGHRHAAVAVVVVGGLLVANGLFILLTHNPYFGTWQGLLLGGGSLLVGAKTVDFAKLIFRKVIPGGHKAWKR